MTNIIQFWQYYSHLFPRQSLPYVLIAGLFLSVFFDSQAISLLNYARHSQKIVFQNSIFLKVFTQYQEGFTYFWICLVSALLASLAYILFQLSTYTSIWLALFLQIFFAWQAFPIKYYAKALLKVKKTFYSEGTMLGLAKLRRSLEIPVKKQTIQETYHQTIEDLITQINLYWFLPFLALLIGFWPLTFFYLAFVIQYQNFQLESKILGGLANISRNLVVLLMKFLLVFHKGDKTEIEDFKTIFLDRKNILFKKKKIKLKKSLKDESKLDSAYDKKQEIEYQELKLGYLEYLEVLHLASMTIIAGTALLIFYIRAKI